MISTSQKSGEQPIPDEMESLFVNNESLDCITAYLNRFNPIRVMKMERMEIRHSAILAWLLDPRETHGLGEEFLRAFLGEALRGHSAMGKPSALDISSSDLRDVEVRCEWLNIDIFLYSEVNRWAFIIENKIDSKQGIGQLERYVDKVRQRYSRRREPSDVRGIFLTLQDEEPAHKEFVPIRYGAVRRILSRLIKQSEDQISSEVKTFLDHYLEILEEITGMSEERTEMERLARQIYREHKKVLDFVMEHGPGSGFVIAARSLFGENPQRIECVEIKNQKYVFFGLTGRLLSFLPITWHEALEEKGGSWKGCEKWWAGFPLISWLEMSTDSDGVKGTVTLYAEVGPLEDFEHRKALIERIRKLTENKTLKIRLQNGADGENKKYSKFLKDNQESVDDIHDSEALAKAMETLLQNFQAEFDAIAILLSEFNWEQSPN